MANATSTQLQELYVAYFGRAADPTGLDYWTAKGVTQAAFAADMYAAPEFESEFGSLSTEAQVNQIYKNLFDREADVTGLNYWTLEINLGNLKVAEIATHLIWAAQNNDGSADDKTALTNRTAAATAYTAKVKESAAAILAYAPTNDGKAADSTYVAGKNITEAKSYLSGIDKDTAHTDAGIAASVTTITTNGAGSGGGKNYVLTTGVDAMSGSTGADTFTGDNTGTINQSSAADTIDGGSGTDTLNIFSDGTVDGLPELTSVEIVNVYDKNDDFDASGQASITTLNQIRGEGDSLLTVGTGVAVGLENIVVGTGTTLSGTTVAYYKKDTTASLTLNKITDSTANEADNDVIITGAKLTTLNLTSTGKESDFDALVIAGVKTVNLTANAKFVAPIETTGTKGTITVTGDSIASIGALDTGFTKVDASANTGGLTVTDQAAGTIITGSSTAADHINVGVLAKTKDVTLGDSAADRIEFTDDTQYTTTSAKIKGAEIARLAGTGSSYDMTRLIGVTDIEVQTTAGTITLNKLSQAQADKITVLNSVTTLTAALSDATGTADSLTVTIDDVDTTAQAITVGDISAASVETINVVVGDTDSLTHIISDLDSSTSAKTLNVSGTANLTITDMTDMASGATVDATGFAENLTVTTIGSGDTVISGSGDDTVGLAFGALGNTTKFALGSGDDSVNITGNGMDMVDADFALMTGVDNLTIASATGASLTLSGYAQAAILSVDKNTDGLLDITAGSLISASTIDASAMINAGVDATVTITTAESTSEITQAIALTGGDSADKFTVTIADASDTGGEDDMNTTITGNNGIDIISYTESSTTSDDTLTIVTTETKVANADIITGFIGNDAGTIFDYNGTLTGNASDVDTGATITAALAVAGAQGGYVVTTDVANASSNTQGTAFNNVLNADASTLATHYAELETQLLAANGTLNGSITSLDADITASESALLVLDNGTGSVIMRITNTTASGNTLLAGELDLVAVMTNATALDDTDFA